MLIFPLYCLSFYYWFVWALWMLKQLGQVLPIIFPGLSFVFWFCFKIPFFHKEVLKLLCSHKLMFLVYFYGLTFIFKSSFHLECIWCKEWGGIHPLPLYPHWPPAAPPVPSCYHATFSLSLQPLSVGPYLCSFWIIILWTPLWL